MSNKEEITTIVDILKQRDTSLFMACQLKDFYAFLSMGGITTKEKLEKDDMPFAQYRTDDIQKANGFWNAHIFHIMDYGAQFYRNAKYLPNIDGPVLFHVKPDILLSAKSVEITDTSVRNEHFQAESQLKPISADAVNNCYKNDASSSFPEKTLLKDELIENSRTGQMLPEIICRFDRDLIPFSSVSLVSVDHYIVNNRQFQSWLDEIKVRAGFTFPLMRRYCPSSTAIHITAEICKMLLKGSVSINDIINSQDEQLQAWGSELKQNHLDDLFDLYNTHLQSDTLLPLFHGEISAEKIDQLSRWAREKNQAIDQLSGKDALSILKELAKTNPDIIKHIQSIKRSE